MIKKLHVTIFLFSILLIQSYASKAQTALRFDGTNDFIQTNYQGILGGASRTVEAWIKTSTSSTNAQKVITCWGSNVVAGRFTFCMLQNNSIRIENGANGISGTLALNDGLWHHVAAVYDPSKTVSLYIDGVLNISGVLPIEVNTVASVNLKIGQRFDGQNNFNGSIDDVRIWNVARTASEIAANKNVEFCSPQPGLVGYYKFNDGVANGTNTGTTSVHDDSGSNYSGTMNGFALTGTTSNFVTGTPLTMNFINGTITNDNTGTLTSNQIGASSYQWVDCNNSNANISGATSQTFSPTAVGNYAVNVTLNGCNITSSCTAVTTLGTSNFDFSNSFKIYPNPTTGIINIKGKETFESIDANVKSVTGQIVNRMTFNNVNNISFELNSPSGIYFITLKTNTGKATTLKLIKL